MNQGSLRRRYRRIIWFFARLLLGFIFWDLILARIGFRALAARTRTARMQKAAQRFRQVAISMGGVQIKMGQFLSTRVDVLPPEVTNELAGLQDEVPPVPFEEIRRAAEAEFNASLEETFAKFDPTPLAAASLGQVHRAKLFFTYGAGGGDPGFSEVIVKIQRPHIDEIIAIDLAALSTVGRWLQRYRPIGRRANVPALLGEFTRILSQEIDYLAEGRSAETFAENFADAPEVHVPRVVWTHTTRRALTLENVWAIKITDYASITQAGIDRSQVARRLLNTYLKQIFEDGFFHADPHPGNLFVTPLPPDPAIPSSSPPWLLTFVDFGMVGQISPALKKGLREMLIGVMSQDHDRLIKAYQDLGFLLPGADVELIKKAETAVFARFWGKTMSELTDISPHEIGGLVHEFRELVFQMPFQVPQDVIFLARAVTILSGLCTGLDPNFNVFEQLDPFSRRLVAEEVIASPRDWLSEAMDIGRSMLSVPRKMDLILSKLERGDIAVRAPEVNRQVRQVAGALRQVSGGIIFTGLLLSGVQLYLAGEQVFANILLAGAAATLGWVIVAGRHSGEP